MSYECRFSVSERLYTVLFVLIQRKTGILNQCRRPHTATLISEFSCANEVRSGRRLSDKTSPSLVILIKDSYSKDGLQELKC